MRAIRYHRQSSLYLFPKATGAFLRDGETDVALWETNQRGSSIFRLGTPCAKPAPIVFCGFLFLGAA